PPLRPAPAPWAASSPGIEPGLRPSQSRVRSGTLRGRTALTLGGDQEPRIVPLDSRASRPGFEPGPGLSKSPVLSVTPPGWDEEPTTGFAPAWTGLRDRCLSESSHVGTSRSARIRTLCDSVGNSLLSQEHTPVWEPASVGSAPRLAGLMGEQRK